MPNDPAPVPDGCGLLPYVPRASAASVAVWRLSASAEGSKIAVALPVRLEPESDEFMLAQIAGGGVFRVQARDHNGRFLKGYPAREIYIEGPPREVCVDVEEPEIDAPPAPPAPEAPRAVASQAVPVANPLPGMPSAMLDVPGIDPTLRAWLARFDASQAYVTEAVRRHADAETAAARAHMEVARSFVEHVTSPQVMQQGEALRALAADFAAVRAELATERAQHAQTRAQGEAALAQARAQAESARIEAATLRALLQAGGRYEAPRRGAMEVIVAAAMRELGPVARGAIAAQLGIPAEMLAQLVPPSDPTPDGTTHAG